ncbi:MAG: hypothetical protein Q9210_002535 [Variospora velana]
MQLLAGNLVGFATTGELREFYQSTVADIVERLIREHKSLYGKTLFEDVSQKAPSTQKSAFWKFLEQGTLETGKTDLDAFFALLIKDKFPLEPSLPKGLLWGRENRPWPSQTSPFGEFWRRGRS